MDGSQLLSIRDTVGFMSKHRGRKDDLGLGCLYTEVELEFFVMSPIFMTIQARTNNSCFRNFQ